MKVIKEQLLTEAPRDGAVDFKLPDDMLNNPNSIDLKGMASKAVADKKAADEEARRQAEFESNRQKYVELIEEVKGISDVGDQLTALFEALVPSRGAADTVAGELVRAMVRIMYRDYNDGDLFYEGYGVETCGSSVAYLIDTVETPKVHDVFHLIADNQYEDDRYSKELDNIGSIIVNYILTDNSVWQPNTEDSRGDKWEQVYERDYREDWEPTYDYDFTIPYSIAEHMDRGNYTSEEFENEIISELENSNITFDSVEVWSDYVYVYGLKRDDYDELESRELYEDSSWEWILDDLNYQYGDPLNDDEDEEEYEEEEDED